MKFEYNINWDIPFEVGTEQNSLLTKYSKLTKEIIFRSEKIYCTSGPFEGPGKYLQFFLLSEPEVHRTELFVRMCYGMNDQDEDFESFEFSFVNTYIYDRGISKSYRRQGNHTSLSNLNVDDSSIPVLIKEWEVEYPKEENVCVKWVKHGQIYGRPDSIERITFSIGVRFGRWPLKLKYEHPSNPASRVSLKPGQLNTSDLLLSTNWSDVTICCGDREFSAHVLILQNASSVLRRMFSQPVVENLTRKLTIEDSEPEVMEEFLRYIYTGTVTEMAKNSVGLIVMAEKYDVQNLKSLCENYVLANISDVNPLELYQLENLLNSDKITSKCIKEIKMNKKTIWKTADEFYEASLKLPKLFYEMFYN